MSSNFNAVLFAQPIIVWLPIVIFILLPARKPFYVDILMQVRQNEKKTTRQFIKVLVHTHENHTCIRE